MSVLGGGHDWAGRSVRDGGLVIDLRNLRTVDIDPVRRIATVGGGALSRDVMTAAAAHGLVAAAGTAGSVGFTGLTLGGGYGPLSGRYGFAIDNVLGAQVVLADGRVVDADADHERELWWALRGGGGNFGVVTTLRVALHRAEPVLGGFLLFDWAGAGQVWRRLGEYLRDCPDAMTVHAGVLSGPDRPAVMLYPTWTGDPAEGAEHMRLLRSFGTLTLDEVKATTYAEMLARYEVLAPAGRHVAIRTRTVGSLSPPVIAALLDGGATGTSPHSAILMHHAHGVATRVPAEAAAFPYRSPHVLIEIVAMWDAGRSGDHDGWAHSVWSALAPHALPGGYVNLIGPDQAGQANEAYGRNTTRLLAAKQAYDPTGLFSATPLPAAVRY